MPDNGKKSEFPEHAGENRRIWDANARWWDDRIGDGNDFQNLLIEPATERLLAISPGDAILDVACGAGRFARRMAELGARVVAFDQSARFVERARERTPKDAAIEYHVIDASDAGAFVPLGAGRFDKAVCTMALMDMPGIAPLVSALARLLKPGGAFVFSVTHPCFNSGRIQRFAEMFEDESGRNVIRTGVKMASYLTPYATKAEGIIGQPEPQFYFHRPICSLFAPFFGAGFVVDGIEEPGFPKPEAQKAGVRWDDMPEIPPVMVARMRLTNGRQQRIG
jgi:SAM-dependent methyltransferase